MNIYVGNISYDTTEGDLQSAFGGHGVVSSVLVATDRDTGRARGFAFVEMANQAEAMAAIQALNGSQLGGRALVVNEARPREERRPTGNRNSYPAGGRNRW